MVKVAILIDGGYFLKRLPRVRPGVNSQDVDEVAESVKMLVASHLSQVNKVYNVANYWQLLYRTFYYDARPYTRREHTPIGQRSIDYARTSQAVFRDELFKSLRCQPNLAVRLGDLRKNVNQFWALKAHAQEDLISERRVFADITDRDFAPSLRQKGVDMRIGLDIAWIALKQQAQIIVLVSGDSDFVPAAKLARREGVQFIVDPLWQNISPDLSEHIDRLTSGFTNPSTRSTSP